MRKILDLTIKLMFFFKYLIVSAENDLQFLKILQIFFHLCGISSDRS